MSAVDNKLEGSWKLSDHLGAAMVRAGIRRNRYRRAPGLYSLGSPNRESPVLVTAGYKLSVDHLRRAVKTMDAWILVLDTKGINVWCAAGKGTFGTGELIYRIEHTGLADRVAHRRVILPQLGAPGIVPWEVRKKTGFDITYGPVEAKDLPAFLAGGNEATETMRIKQFPLRERLAVSFTHFTQGIPPSLGILVLLFLADLLFLQGTAKTPGISLGINALLVLGATFTGTILAGVLLPVLPGRAFSLKGLTLGLLFGIALYFGLSGLLLRSPVFTGGKILLLLGWIVFQVLNLTGSSTYTSLSGVQKEMAVAIPLLVGGSTAALIMIIAGGILL